MAVHDHGYKQLFSHPEMVRDLLLGFVTITRQPYRLARSGSASGPGKSLQ